MSSSSPIYLLTFVEEGIRLHTLGFPATDEDFFYALESFQHQLTNVDHALLFTWCGVLYDIRVLETLTQLGLFVHSPEQFLRVINPNDSLAWVEDSILAARARHGNITELIPRNQ